MKQSDFFVKVDMIGSFVCGLLWYCFPCDLLNYNFELKKYDSIHIHFAKLLGITFIINGLYSYYALNNNCAVTKTKILSIKLTGYIFVLFTMILDNLNSKLMDNKHVSFGMFGLLLLVINCYLAIRSLRNHLN